VKITAVCHGDAGKAVLSDVAYLARFKLTADPNLPLIRDLKKGGVELFVCGQSPARAGVQGGGSGDRGPGR